jgi:hypothetical protein
MSTPINEIVEKWEKTHLLDELSASKKTNCAISLEEMAQLILRKAKQIKEEKEKRVIQELAGELLPIVRRLYSQNIKLMPKMEQLYEDYVKFKSSDIEAMIIEMYVKDYTARLNK